MEDTQICLSLLPEDTNIDVLVRYLEDKVGLVWRCKLKRTHPPVHDRICLTSSDAEKPERRLATPGYPVHAFVHFATANAAQLACKLSQKKKLRYQGNFLEAQGVYEGKLLYPTRRQIGKNVIALKSVTIDVGHLVSWKEFLVSWRGLVASFELNVAAKKFRLLFSHDCLFSSTPEVWAACEFKLEFRLRDVNHVFETKEDGLCSSILLQFRNAPTISYRIGGEIYHSCSFSLPDDGDPWIRTVDFTPDKSIGRCLQYKMHGSPSQQSAVRKMISVFSNHGLLAKRTLFDLSLPYEVKHWTQREAFYNISESTLPFELQFLLTSLVHRGMLSYTSLDVRFYDLLQTTATTTASMALRHMLTYRNPVFDPSRQLREIIRWMPQDIKMKKNQLTEGLVLVYRLIITPTKAYCVPPEFEMSNRVLRHYLKWLDSFLRVTFLDDDMEQLRTFSLRTPVLPLVRECGNSNFRKDKTPIYWRVLSILRDGFQLCGRRYSFLMFSQNQLRDNSAWFFAGNGQLQVDGIREWMGTFPQRNVAKCAARMGQCFSQTFHTLEVPSTEVARIGDIVINGYNFSDGIGKISPDLARKVADILKIKGETPSAFQIRYAGCKGVIATWAFDARCKEKLVLRTSMDKFVSMHRVLEVVQWSRFLPSFLNRQLITLLSTLHVGNHVFIELQENMVSRLNRILSDTYLALELLTTSCSGGDAYNVAVSMLTAGFSPMREPHLKDLLLAIRASQLEELVSKSKIYVPQGRLLLGCLDETASLKYGQCFLRVSSPCIPLVDTSGQTFVVTGKVIMARNPCLHPGDIRVLEAIDTPLLYHMVDCLVLPQDGPRPHQDEASGGDLDGDIFSVFWDPSLLPPSGKSWEPMDYVQLAPWDLGRSVGTQDIVHFFVKHIASDKLGNICNAHVVHADLSPIGALDEKCIELAKLAAIAVDFPKTGVIEDMRAELQPKQYPDFMEKEDKQSYKSEKILGILYRSAKHFIEDASDEMPDQEDMALDHVYDSSLEIPGHEQYLDDAWQLKCAYDERLRALMGQFSVKSEGEVTSGFIRLRKRGNSRRQSDLSERIKTGYYALRTEFRKQFESGHSRQVTEDEAFECERLGDYLYSSRTQELPAELHGRLRIWEQRGSAWYHVTYHENWTEKATKLDDPEVSGFKKLFSFPWIAADVLCKIKHGSKVAE